MNRKTVLSNYIPHKQPLHVNFDLWFKYHKKDLINLYIIFKQKMEYEFRIKNWSNIEFTKFVYFIFNSSSKNYKIEFENLVS